MLVPPRTSSEDSNSASRRVTRPLGLEGVSAIGQRKQKAHSLALRAHQPNDHASSGMRCRLMMCVAVRQAWLKRGHSADRKEREADAQRAARATATTARAGSAVKMQGRPHPPTGETWAATTSILAPPQARAPRPSSPSRRDRSARTTRIVSPRPFREFSLTTIPCPQNAAQCLSRNSAEYGRGGRPNSNGM